ncbi:laccase-14 [Ricinus communis]|uniref:Laccase n=1 Tax=Ricinus communis TaxID=3988 RepID=B9SMA9_RICCO|nr:laccase-14 [Ricinus communis]EEF35291.1 laccase, putative [Ricinus communis]|eukprot:XP_002527128.1 laccase-14 [Ricinus communis]
MEFLNKNLVLGLLSFLFLDFLIICMAEVHHYEFVIKESNFTKLCSSKSMLAVNESFPGPVIKVRRGDFVNVTVHNQGTYGITIHWHGVKQPRNPWADGPEYVTQCPVPANTSFTHEIILSDEEGTLWWHAHSDWSRATVHGAFVILPPEGKSYPYDIQPDEEQLIVLGSWYKGDVMAIYKESLETGGNPNTSDAHTINGYTGNSTDCPTGEKFTMNVTYGKTYLLRIINAVMNEEQFFGIAGHNLTLVGMDAAYQKPFTTDYLMITPGQTMDVLLTANANPSQYYMVSTPYFDSFAEFDDSTVYAVVQYTGNYTPPTAIPGPTLPETRNASAAVNFTASLKSLNSTEYPISVPKRITKKIFMTVSLNVLPCPSGRNCSGPPVASGEMTVASASLNNISYSSPTNASILEAYYNGTSSSVFTKNFPVAPEQFNFTGNVTGISQYTNQGTKVIMIDYGAEVEMVLQGTAIQSPENHPMHLHGYSYYLVGIGTGNWDNVISVKNYNLYDPPLINTVGVPQNGWVAIRFKADNPGVWFMHCHLERHTTWGMDTVVIVKNGKTEATSIIPPPAYMPPCPSS